MPKRYTIEELTCPECGFVAVNANGLRGHRQFKHGVRPSGAQLPLQKQDLLVSESMLDQRLSELESKLGFTQSRIEQRLGIAARPITKDMRQHTKQLKEQQELLKELQKQLKDARSFDERLTELPSLLGEAVSVIGEDLCLLLVGIDGHKHEPETGAVTFTAKQPLADRLKIALEQAKAWEFSAAVAEMFRPVARMAKGLVDRPSKPGEPKAKKGQPAEEPKTIQGKTDKPGYKFLEHLNLSVRE